MSFFFSGLIFNIFFPPSSPQHRLGGVADSCPLRIGPSWALGGVDGLARSSGLAYSSSAFLSALEFYMRTGASNAMGGTINVLM